MIITFSLMLLYITEFFGLTFGLPFAYHYNLIDTDERFTNELDDIQPEIIEPTEVTNSTASYWNYEDSSSWSQVYDSCNGNYQSPINIDPAKAITKSYPKLIFGNYDRTWPMSITNDGHTVLLDLPRNYPANMLPFIRGGGLPDQFNFVQLHFHWGGDSGRGSEHLIQSKQYSGELHIVHYNSKYISFTEATKHKDGVAVLAILMESGSADNSVLQNIVGQFVDILQGGQTAKLHNPILLQDLLPANIQNFYRYDGSLTTPTCQEVVSWTVFETPIPVSEYQLRKFRQLFDKKGRRLNDNFRPIQEDRGRVITYRSGNDHQSFNQQKYSLTSSPVQQFQSWEQALDFFKHSEFNSQEFFKWQPFNRSDKLQNILEIPNWNSVVR
ncbi:Carbonic anhydrase 6 [Daphnia magna]|uniref:Carbonic anhydrase n=1 Tax=Daphnia magna TaxID=35525 RepID=A0A162RFE0_9CRUS|nr:Carbonic anhydrase 6 [Daphnia magna]